MEKGDCMKDRTKTYTAKRIVDNPLLDNISSEVLIAWFRCNSCITCKFREQVIDKDPEKDIEWCSHTHDRHGIVDMVKYLGFSME